MSRWTPCKRRDFIRKLNHLSFRGPLMGSRHQFMVYDAHRLAIPSNNEYSIPQVKMMLHEIEEIVGRRISLNEWNKL